MATGCELNAGSSRTARGTATSNAPPASAGKPGPARNSAAGDPGFVEVAVGAAVEVGAVVPVPRMVVAAVA
jgi:hypothetical protein